MSAYFISAIGTGVGKTVVTAALSHQLREKNMSFKAIKPIISGYDGSYNTDTAILLKAQGLAKDGADIISPWRFTAPLSPHMAATLEGRQIVADEVIRFCKEVIAKHDLTLIEGAGGLMVPLIDDVMLIDWIKALAIPTILVSSSYLGAINHTLLSVEALKARQIPIAAIVVNETAHDSIGLSETVGALRPLISHNIPILSIPRLQDKPWMNAPDLLSLLV